jgi:hypothetical protein
MASSLGDIRSLDKFYGEAASRPIRRRRLEVVDYQPADARPQTHLALEGTITILAARQGSKLMADIRASLSKGANTEDVAGRLYRQYKRRKRGSLTRALKTAVSQNVFADVLHGDRTLVEGLFVPSDLEVAFLPLPYNGALLADDGIVLVEHPLADDAEALDILVLRHAPPLTKAERAAIGKVPKEQRAMNVGNSLGPRACSVLLLTAAVAVEVAVVAVTFAITGKVDLMHMAHIRPSDLKKMGPSKSARVLAEKRRELLKRKPKKKKTLHG